LKGDVLLAENIQTNSNAVISLTLGILSLSTPYIGLILGIIGIVYAKKAKKEMALTDKTSRGLAHSGFICSVIGLCIQTFVSLLFIVIFYFAG
jgi:hypothetical protein